MCALVRLLFILSKPPQNYYWNSRDTCWNCMSAGSNWKCGQPQTSAPPPFFPGFDAHKKDEINFRYIGVTERDYEWITEQVVAVANR